jgi:hypothetical protein
MDFESSRLEWRLSAVSPFAAAGMAHITSRAFGVSWMDITRSFPLAKMSGDICRRCGGSTNCAHR